MKTKPIVIEKIILAFLTLAVFLLMISHLYSPLSVALSLQKKVGIFVSAGNDKLVFYYPARNLSAVLNLKNKFKGNTALKYLKTGEYISKNFSIINAPFFYLSLNETEVPKAKKLLKRKGAAKALGFLKLAYEIKKRGGVNLAWHDLALAYLEFIKLKNSNFIITRFSGKINSDRVNFYILKNNMESKLGEKLSKTPKIKVLNASDKKGVAYRISKYLRSEGMDVVEYGNYPSIEKFTKIVNCSKDLRSALEVRKSLKLDSISLYSRYDALSIADAVLIVGQDFNDNILPKTGY